MLGLLLLWACVAVGAPAKRVAVLGFQNLSGDPSLDYVGAGFGATLTTKLMRVQELDLIERMQIADILKEQGFQLSGLVDEASAVEAGKILGVEYVVIGSFQKMAGQIKANARLVAVKTAKVYAAQDVRGRYQDLFDLQEALALKLIEDLDVLLSQSEKKAVAKNETKSLSAYEWYSKGVAHLEAFEYDDAIAAFEKAIAIDPDYAHALHKLGVASDVRGFWDQALNAYQKALGVWQREGEESNLAATYNNIGVIYRKKGDNDRAMEYYQKSLETRKRIGDQKGMATTYYNMHLIFKQQGETQKAIDYLEKSVEIECRIGHPDCAKHREKLKALRER